MNREKQDSAYDMLGFRVVHVLNNCLLRVMPPVEQHGKRRSVRIPRLVCVLRAVGHSSLEMYRQPQPMAYPSEQFCTDCRRQWAQAPQL
jgi:hypothetical protein